MTTQDKCLFIIKELELSARQVATVIGKKQQTVSDKIKNRNFNKFLDADFEKLQSFYIEKLEKIKTLPLK